MKQALKQIALRGLTARPIYSLLQRRALRDGPVSILCYHTLRPRSQTLDAWTTLSVEDFRAQIAMLRQSYDIVSLDAVVQCRSGGRPKVVLTFDDGELGLFEHLLPIVEAENLPVTIYVATAQIETGQAYWFDRVMNALQGPGPIEIDMQAAGLAPITIGPLRGKERWRQIGPVLQWLKSVPTDQRDARAQDIIDQVADQADGFVPLQPLTLEQLQQLAAHKAVTIGAHTHGHELLDQLTLKEARDSIVTSRRLLQDWTGASVDHFAYPNGNYTPDLMELLAELGFTSATILEDRLMQKETPPMALPRIGVGRYDSVSRLQLRMVGR